MFELERLTGLTLGDRELIAIDRHLVLPGLAAVSRPRNKSLQHQDFRYDLKRRSAVSTVTAGLCAGISEANPGPRVVFPARSLPEVAPRDDDARVPHDRRLALPCTSRRRGVALRVPSDARRWRSRGARSRRAWRLSGAAPTRARNCSTDWASFCACAAPKGDLHDSLRHGRCDICRPRALSSCHDRGAHDWIGPSQNYACAAKRSNPMTARSSRPCPAAITSSMRFAIAGRT